MSDVATHISAFLREYLPIQRNVSQHTCDAYAYAFKLLFIFASTQLGVAPCALELQQLDAPLVMGFLAHLKTERGNSPQTCNARLAAIKSFMRFIQYRVPAALAQVQSILAIGSSKIDKRIVRPLDADEVEGLLAAPDPTTRLGIRDRAMLQLAIASGLRVSELVGLKNTDITFRDAYIDIYVMGKGRRERTITLKDPVIEAIRAWLSVRGETTVPELFLNSNGHSLTRSGFTYILRKHTKTASVDHPSLLKKRVSPHVLRHTAAILILQATGDIRKVALVLGHASQQTTEKAYLGADPMKRLEIAEAILPPTLRPGVFSPPDKLLDMLKRSQSGAKTAA